MLGIVLTLVAMLLIHLLFTAQYHWPMAPVNYVLQLSGVTTLLISLIATIHVVLSASFTESKQWPYMLSYISVNIPPCEAGTSVSDWSLGERVTWLIMNASTSGLIQVVQGPTTAVLHTELHSLRSPIFSSSLFFILLGLREDLFLPFSVWK